MIVVQLIKRLTTPQRVILHIQQTTIKSMDFSSMYTLATEEIYGFSYIYGNEMFRHALLFKLNAV